MILILLKNHLLCCHLKYRKMVVNFIGLAVVVQLESSQLNTYPCPIIPYIAMVIFTGCFGLVHSFLNFIYINNYCKETRWKSIVMEMDSYY